MEFLETSVVIRYLTKDPVEMAVRAAALIASRSPLYITGTALAETAHVLRTVYDVDRVTVVDLLKALIQEDGVLPYPSNAERVLDGLELCRPSNKVSIPDALIWAAAASSGPAAVVYTFDRRFPRAGVELREPPPGEAAVEGAGGADYSGSGARLPD
jgi:predicted nucleic acid-binding protein